MEKTYKNLVFTKHAAERLKDRSLTQDYIFQVVNDPDKTYPSGNSTKFIKTINDRTVHVVANPLEKAKWLIISLWVRGEDDPEPLVWQLIAFPFRFIFKVLQEIIEFSRKKSQE